MGTEKKEVAATIVAVKEVTVEALKPLRKKGVKRPIAVGKTTTLPEPVAKTLEKSGNLKIITETNTGDNK